MRRRGNAPYNRRLKRCSALMNYKFRVCLMSHSSGEKLSAYGYGPAKLLAAAKEKLLEPDVRISFFDLKENFGDTQQDVEIVRNENPDILGLSVFLWNFDRVENILCNIRETLPDTIIVLGGPNAPGYELLSKQPWLPDFIVTGEGEEAFVSIVKKLVDGSLRSLDSISTKTDMRKKGLFKPQILSGCAQSLESSPSPYLTNVYVPPGELVYMETSRGCPNQCSFCVSGNERAKIRFFSLDIIRREIAWAFENCKKNINFCDAALNYNNKRLKEIAQAALDVDPSGKLSFTFALHADHLSAAQIEILSRLNIACATMGLNSTNPATFDTVKRSIDPEKFKEKVSLLKKLPNSNITIMMGLPGDTVDGFKRTLEYCASLDVQINCYELRVFPGTLFFDNASRFDLKYDLSDGLKALSCFSYSNDDLNSMRELFEQYAASSKRFVRGDQTPL